MYRIESIELGEYRGDEYFLVGFVEPEPQEGEDYDPDEDARNYGVALVQKGVGVLGENTQIARMDTRHGQAHLDKEFVPPDADDQDTVLLDEGYPYERMWSYFLQHWETFADRHIYYNE